MVYGFISSLDDETTKVFFRSKKIRGNNIYCAGSLGALTSVTVFGAYYCHCGAKIENWANYGFVAKCLFVLV